MSASADGVLVRLAGLVRAEGGLLADAIGPEPRGLTPHAELVARGPRARGHAADLPLVVEAVREGYLLHYGHGRLMARDDEDLAMLAGDRLYALGLEALAAAGDLDAVRALADVIALSARAAAAGDEELADAVWLAGVTEVGWGPAAPLEAAKDAARMGDEHAVARLQRAARQAGMHLAPNR